MLVVVMSYSSFFVSRQALPARGGLASVCFLTLANMITGVLQTLPKTLGNGSILLLNMLHASQFFCLYTVIEFAAISYTARLVTRADKFRKDLEAEAATDVEEERDRNERPGTGE